MKNPIAKTIATAAILLASTACSGLSSDARKMTGNYYINEISTDTPVLELRPNGTAIQRAILPGVLTYCVKGKWNVKNDSLIITKNSRPFDIEGDSTLIGNIPRRTARAVVAFNGTTLTLRHNGADYVYYRRGEK